MRSSHDFERVVGNSSLSHWFASETGALPGLRSIEDHVFQKRVVGDSDPGKIFDLKFRMAGYSGATWTNGISL